MYASGKRTESRSGLRFDSGRSSSNELQSLESFSLTSFGSSVSRWEIYAVQVGALDFFIKEMPMDTKGCKCCCTCKWYAVCEGVCCNGDSEHCADFRCMDDSYKCWEENKHE